MARKFPGSLLVRTPCFHYTGAQVQSPLGELRSLKLCDMTLKKKNQPHTQALTKKQATKNPKLSDLKQQKCILMVLEVKKNLNLRCWQDCAPSKGSGGSFRWRRLPVVACCPRGTPVSAPVFTRLLSLLSSPLLSLRRTFAVKFRAHLGNPA